MIRFEGVGYRYPGRPHPALSDITWTVHEGAFALVTGESGSGKSTLLRCINGLAPHFSGGELLGAVHVDGMDTRRHGPRELSRRVGFVFQDPDAQHVAPTVEDELAFGMEQHGVGRPEMRARVEETLERLRLGHLRGRVITTLSGGERQRVAIGAAMAMRQLVLVLDEPLSQLDPRSAGEVLEAMRSLSREDGVTVVVAEHRLEDLGRVADVRLGLAGGRVVSTGDGWPAGAGAREAHPCDDRWGEGPRRSGGAEVRVQRADLGIGRVVLREVDLEIGRGEIVVLVGENGSGKTTLLRSLLGAVPPMRGTVTVDAGGGAVAYLPQRPGAVLFNETVRAEIGFTRRVNPGAGDPAWLVSALELGPLLDRDTRDLSVGERERAALAAVLSADPALALLDEPTRGMDGRRKAMLAGLLRASAARGTTVVVATHDATLVDQLGARVVLLEEGAVADAAREEARVPRGPSVQVLDSRA